MSTDFRDLLSKPLDEVAKPKCSPAGTYHSSIAGYTLEESLEKKTPYVRVNLGDMSPGDDIEAEQVTGTVFRGRKAVDFFLTDDAYYRVKDFLASLGLDTAGRTVGELLPEITGAPVICDVTVAPNRHDPDDYFNNIKSIKGMPR